MGQNCKTTLNSNLPPCSLVSAKEMLPLLPIKRSTLWKWVKMGTFPSPVKVNSLTRWRVEEVDAWLAQFTKEVDQTQEHHSYGG